MVNPNAQPPARGPKSPVGMLVRAPSYSFRDTATRRHYRAATYGCINPACNGSFATQKGLQHHYQMRSDCNAFTLGGVSPRLTRAASRALAAAHKDDALDDSGSNLVVDMAAAADSMADDESAHKCSVGHESNSEIGVLAGEEPPILLIAPDANIATHSLDDDSDKTIYSDEIASQNSTETVPVPVLLDATAGSEHQPDDADPAPDEESTCGSDSDVEAVAAAAVENLTPSDVDDAGAPLGDATMPGDAADIPDSPNLLARESNDQMDTVERARFGMLFTTAECIELRLLKLLDDNNVKHGLYQDIMKWARKANMSGYNFNPRRTTRNAQVQHFGKRVQRVLFEPVQTSITLPEGPSGPENDVVPVTTFKFRHMLLSLLQDPVLTTNLDLLDVNPDDPFGRYIAPDGRLGTMNSGSWYQRAFEHHCKDPNDFLVPLVLDCDETTIEQGKKHMCWPINFTTSIFGYKMRNQHFAWRPLGYVYDTGIDEVEKTAYRQHKEDCPLANRQVKHTRLQRIFQEVLRPLVEAQQPGALDNIEITLGNVTKVVNLKIPVMVVIGDMQGGDKICGTKCAYSNKQSRPCRKCNVHGSMLGDPYAECRRISQTRIMDLIQKGDTQRLDVLCQYHTPSAWFDLDYGGCKFGIFSAACPVEGLHALENGLILHMLKTLLKHDITGATAKRQLDDLIRRLGRLPRQRNVSSGSDPGMPRLRWKDGVTTLTGLTGVQKVGVMFSILILSFTKEGQEFFDGVMGEDRRSNMQYIFAMMMCYWQWLKLPSYWALDDPHGRAEAKEAITKMGAEIQRFWPRVDGQSWSTCKFHEQKHIPDDIHRHGSPRNTHAARTENGHIIIKDKFNRTQRIRKYMDYQIALRRTETYVIDRAYAAMQWSEDGFEELNLPKIHPSTKVQWREAGSSAEVIITRNAENGTFQFVYANRSNTFTIADVALRQMVQKHFEIDPEHYANDRPTVRIDLFTELVRNGVMIRSHLNYRRNGPWVDWVMVRWDCDDAVRRQPSRFRTTRDVFNECQPDFGDSIPANERRNYGYSPARVLGFMCAGNPQYFALVAPCEFSYTKSSIFTTKWKMDVEGGNSVHAQRRRKARNEHPVPVYQLIDCESIVRRCVMIPVSMEDPFNVEYHEVWEQERWGNLFHTPVTQP